MFFFVRYLLLGLLSLSVPLGLSAQRTPPRQLSREQVARIPIDTIVSAIKGSDIIVYSNNTWEYFHKDVTLSTLKDAYNTNWDTTQIFAYKELSYNDLPEVVELPLVDDISQFYPPIVGRVSSKYGPRRRTNHNGTDVPVKTGQPIYSPFEGKVRYARYNSGGFGYLVIIRHANGLETWHAHLSRLNVAVNDFVKAGQVIGFGGNTGRSRGSHLHFEMRYKDQTFDPEFLVDFESGLLRYQVFSLEKNFFNIHSRASEILEEEDYEYTLSGSVFANADDSIAVRAASRQIEQGTKNTPVLSSSSSVYHTIKSGDMLGKLAIRYGVTVSQICRLNNIKPTTMLRLNQRLRIK